MIYYNDNDPKAWQWLTELKFDGLIPDGYMEILPIQKIDAGHLDGFHQAHFFAGIGGWAYALELAGWPRDQPVWTGSCPCQPFSQAGKGRGENDPRHLWPEWRRLIAECKPPVVFGEQVASPAGRSWLSSVRADLEALGYAVGCADLCAASVGAPQIRQRLFWVASAGGHQCREGRPGEAGCSGGGWMGGTGSPGSGRNSRAIPCPEGESSSWRGLSWVEPDQSVATGDFNWLPCQDGKLRPIEPGLEPLVDGLPGRVGLLRGYGNAIVPQVAAEFVRAFMGAL